MSFEIKDNEIFFMRAGEVVRISSCGKNCIRFQASANCKIEEENWTLMPQKTESRAWIEGNHATLEAGDMRAIIYDNGRVEYYRHGNKIIEEKPELTFDAQIRNYRNIASGLWKSRVTFAPNENEHFYGMGHEATGCFDLKGCTMDLRHVNTKCAIPFVYSSIGYGFLWNMPSTGRCELSNNRTRRTTDIGGFYGGEIETDYFRELIVRWFQYGVFCPVLRLHGSREGHDRTRDIIEPTGGDNELWSFGDRVAVSTCSATIFCLRR